MANRVEFYWPRAEVVAADGSVMEIKVEEGMTSLLHAIRLVRKWKEEYKGKIRKPMIDVRGAKRRKYVIDMTNMK